MEVAAVVGEDAVVGVLAREKGREGASGVRDRLEDEERREDAVPLREKEGDAEPPRLLPADPDLAGEHLLGDVLEPDRRDVERHAELRGDPVEKEGRRKGLRDPAADPPASGEALGEEGEDPVGRHEPSGGVEDAQTIAVPVARENEVEALAAERLDRGGEVPGDRLRD